MVNCGLNHILFGSDTNFVDMFYLQKGLIQSVRSQQLAPLLLRQCRKPAGSAFFE
jgi:hypothetical protein